MQGRIDRVIHSRGFGFIRTESGEDILFHRADLLELSFHKLKEGQVVEFELPNKVESTILRAVLVRPRRVPKSLQTVLSSE